MNISEEISSIEATSSIETLQKVLQNIIENYGFAAFSFVDAGTPYLDEPFHFETVAKKWIEDYKNHKFIHVDPCVTQARKSNLPFLWDVKEIDSSHSKQTKELCEAVQDHNMKNGFVIPFHFVDELGRTHSSVIGLFWKSKLHKLKFLLTNKKHEIHLILIYWSQQAIKLIAETERMTEEDSLGIMNNDKKLLTDRERTILSWSSRGKTSEDIADILTISKSTADTHIRNIIKKLNASNKTHAVVKAIYLGYIDP